MVVDEGLAFAAVLLGPSLVVGFGFLFCGFGAAAVSALTGACLFLFAIMLY